MEFIKDMMDFSMEISRSSPSFGWRYHPAWGNGPPNSTFSRIRTEEGVKRGISMARVFGIDALVVIGGDGSFRGARDLARLGMKVVGIPGTN